MRRSLLAVTLLLAVPATADAATVTASGTPPAVQFQAAPGEANDLRVRDIFTTTLGLEVSDAGAPLTSDGSCAAGPPVVCPGAPFVAWLGDRGDRASVISMFQPTTVYGEDGNDDILSSGLAGYAFGGPGNDQVRVNSNGEAVGHGGAGNDTVRAGSAFDASAFGDSGNDLLIQETAERAMLDGGSGSDILIGLPNMSLPSQAHGGDGSDVLLIGSPAGAGRLARWTLTGDAGNDAIAGGPGADTLEGGSGSDDIRAAGGGADTVTCGSGFDVVRADASDTVAADCERVSIGKTARASSQVRRALRLARSQR